MDYGGCEYLVPCGKDKYISKNELLLHLKTYNIYYEGQNLQLRHREEEGELIVEGLLNISWGLRRPIRLQMQDDNQRIRPPPSSSSWHSGCNLGAHGLVLKPSILPDIQVTDVDATMNAEGTGSSTGAARLQPEEPPQLLRTRSDVGVRHRGSARTPSEQRRIRRHRFSINGHFYNHKTSVFTPAYGSVTNVRINSTMTTPQVLKLLLNKFKIENSAEEFALYIVHTSGGEAAGKAQLWDGQACWWPWWCKTGAVVITEKQKLRATDYPLIARILQGPCEQVSKVFLMEKDQVEEVTYDVAQYIKFEMPVLRSFIQKLEEEEDREVKKLMRKYSILRLMIEQRLEEISEGPARL
ncbi:ras association domain-containing protein 2 isoform X1 [Cygnus olor]|uniref:ras association domain-containing protein 2 isoform X1 n=1 Tax=Cygnus olor TaxID=8869 RepID=UPI001ADE07DD|nr:ras association domain-containing protein 2 isoform X1 [Cygnus olor]